MSEQSKSDLLLAESISALVDNEASELELARILKATDANKVLQTWAAYQIAGAAMRRDLPADFNQGLSRGFAERVSAAIAEEPAHKSEGTQKGLSGWWLGLSRIAVAASVAGAVVIGAQWYEQDVTVPMQGMASSTSPAVDAPDTSLPMGYNAPALPVRTVSAQYGVTPPARQVIFTPHQPTTTNIEVSSEQIRVYLDQLVGYHIEHAAVNSAQGMLPYVRLPLAPKELPLKESLKE